MIKLVIAGVGLISLGIAVLWYWLMVAPMCKKPKRGNEATLLGVVYKKDQ